MWGEAWSGRGAERAGERLAQQFDDVEQGQRADRDHADGNDRRGDASPPVPGDDFFTNCHDHSLYGDPCGQSSNISGEDEKSL